jgi:hypothetical protein
LEPVDQALLRANIALGTLPRSPEEAASTSEWARDAALVSGNPSLIAYTTLVYAITHPLEAAVAYDHVYRVTSEVRNRFYALMASEGTAWIERAALDRGASTDDVNRALSSSIAVCRDYYRAGRLSHAHVMARDVAAWLFELDRPGVAAALLGGCDAVGTIATLTSTPLSAALAELSAGGGSDELRRTYEFGRRTKFLDLLRLVEDSNSSAES